MDTFFQNTENKTGLSKADLEQLVNIIRVVVREEMNNYTHACRFKVSESEAEQVGHFMTMMTDLGNGKLDEGVRIIQRNHEWLRETREKSSKIASGFIAAITGAVALALVYTIWEGVKKKLGL